MTRWLLLAAAAMLLAVPHALVADVLHMGPGLTSLEIVPVGDPGNAPHLTGRGAVDHVYFIGKYEVTAAQYCEFLNDKAKSDPYGLYNTKMDTAVNASGCNIKRSGSAGSYTYSVAADWANRPVNYVSFWDACRFANWLNNGQGDGGTETGAYTLGGYTGSGFAIPRNPGAKWFVPNADEWFKAAAYKGGTTDAGYWSYATQSDTQPGNQVISPDPGNNANFYWGSYPNPQGYTLGLPYYRTPVGEFENSESPYGTFDQTGNVMEWCDAGTPEPYPTTRGGAYMTGDTYIRSATQNWIGALGEPAAHWDCLGFRVAHIPEPPSLLALLAGVGALAAIRRPRA